ncbi:hypothetical protein BC833DRAFT_647273 [Globomyces pollinis-pini]|nr:hypothetical protein BC833DRAFT_647273 [Globomyces pollinis-pini]
MDLKEKETQRKKSHSAIERKRRERIAECMDKLKKIVPKNHQHEFLQKLTILENTVEYIEKLQKERNINVNDFKSLNQLQFEMYVPPSKQDSIPSNSDSISKDSIVSSSTLTDNQFNTDEQTHVKKKIKINDLLT